MTNKLYYESVVCKSYLRGRSIPNNPTLRYPNPVMAGHPGPRAARPEDKLKVPATHQHRFSRKELCADRSNAARAVSMGGRDKPGHDEHIILRECCMQIVPAWSQHP